jgi:copper(I)-binding protein
MLAGIAAHGAQAVFDIRATDAWIRWLPAALPEAGYLTLTNTGSAPQVLVGASSEEYADISLHRTRVGQGMSVMEPVESIRLAPAAEVNFAAAGYHFMLLRPAHPPRPGERILITLRFAGGHSLTVPFSVRASALSPGDNAP